MYMQHPPQQHEHPFYNLWIPHNNNNNTPGYLVIQCNNYLEHYVLVWIALISAASGFPHIFFFFFLFFSAAMVDRSSVNSAFVHCSRTSQTLLFINFFIKNGSHSTIYTFKNYFATVFSVFSFQFQQNKFYPNKPYIKHSSHNIDVFYFLFFIFFINE